MKDRGDDIVELFSHYMNEIHSDCRWALFVVCPDEHGSSSGTAGGNLSPAETALFLRGMEQADKVHKRHESDDESRH